MKRKVNKGYWVKIKVIECKWIEKEGRFMPINLPDYSLDLTEKDYEARVKSFIRSNFSDFRRRQAEMMTIDLMESNENVTWLYLDKALHKKSVGEWERYGFGLMYRKEFQGYVWKAIERDYEIDSLGDDQSYYDILEDYSTDVQKTENSSTVEEKTECYEDETDDFYF